MSLLTPSIFLLPLFIPRGIEGILMSTTCISTDASTTPLRSTIRGLHRFQPRYRMRSSNSIPGYYRPPNKDRPYFPGSAPGILATPVTRSRTYFGAAGYSRAVASHVQITNNFSTRRNLYSLTSAFHGRVS
ncbi:hypothetical protein F5Y12DRAFT_58008 [Xylaria sp. FL1777]|nr:hypothetical protein F5Y12DRAFT_58008 [Xylaria sp. FL1777]